MFFSIKIYHTACFFQAQETVLSAIGGCSVEQCRVLRRVRCGSVPLYTTKPAQAQGSRLPAMRHRSLNNFHKKWDNNYHLMMTDYCTCTVIYHLQSLFPVDITVFCMTGCAKKAFYLLRHRESPPPQIFFMPSHPAFYSL